MRYVSIDIETTGLDIDTCRLIEIGAVIDDLGSRRPLDELPTFQCYVSPNSPYLWEGPAYDMHRSILHKLLPSNGAVRDNRAVSDLAQWLESHGFSSGSKLGPVAFQAAGKNFGGFDWQVLRRIPGAEMILAPSHRLLDPAMLYLDPTKDTRVPSLSTCLERAGLPATVAHNAVDDAMDVVRLLRKGIPQRSR